MDLRALVRPFKMQHNIAGHVLIVLNCIMRDTDMVVPQGVTFGIDVHWIRWIKTSPRWRNLALVAGEVTKPVLLKRLRERKHSILLSERVVSKLDRKLVIEMDNIRQSGILASGLLPTVALLSRPLQGCGCACRLATALAEACALGSFGRAQAARG